MATRAACSTHLKQIRYGCDLVELHDSTENEVFWNSTDGGVLRQTKKTNARARSITLVAVEYSLSFHWK